MPRHDTLRGKCGIFEGETDGIIIGEKIDGSIPVVADAIARRDSAILDPANCDRMGVIYPIEALPGLNDCCMEYISACREGLFGPRG